MYALNCQGLPLLEQVTGHDREVKSSLLKVAVVEDVLHLKTLL